MGKKGGKKNGGFVHVHSYNVNKHESAERKERLREKVELKRLNVQVDTDRQSLRFYVADKPKKKPVQDPAYHLKGAARVAAQFYKDPNAAPEVKPVDVFVSHAGKMSEHPQGKLFLAHMAELGIFLHDTKKCKSAVKIFEEMLELEPRDVEAIRPVLLDSYQQSNMNDKAQELLATFSDEELHELMVNAEGGEDEEEEEGVGAHEGGDSGHDNDDEEEEDEEDEEESEEEEDEQTRKKQKTDVRKRGKK